jgi:surface polysaccharide O-acyltransferase-like enzyme
MNSEISRTITALRFPLIVGVVLIHSGIFPIGYTESQLPILAFVEQLFSKVLPRFCVPMFFMIAGYLFFAKCDKPTIAFFVKQYKKRFKSLVIPYIFWNAVVIAIFWTLHRFVPGSINPDYENVANYPPHQLLNCFWAGSGGQPIAYQLWFLRDLIVSVVFTPIVYLLFAKRENKIANRCTMVLMAVYTVAFLSIPKLGLPISYYFVLGSFLSLHNINFVDFAKQTARYLWPIAIITIGLKFMDCGPYTIVDGIYVFAASIIAIEIARRLPTTTLSKLAESSFFIYAYHGIVILLTTKLLSTILHKPNQFVWLVIYFIQPIAIIALGHYVYKLLKRILPGFTAFITGGR